MFHKRGVDAFFETSFSASASAKNANAPCLARSCGVESIRAVFSNAILSIAFVFLKWFVARKKLLFEPNFSDNCKVIRGVQNSRAREKDNE